MYLFFNQPSNATHSHYFSPLHLMKRQDIAILEKKLLIDIKDRKTKFISDSVVGVRDEFHVLVRHNITELFHCEI